MRNWYLHTAKLISRLISASIIMLCCLYGVAFAVTNTTDFNITQPFYVSEALNSAASMFVVDNGSIVGNLLDGKSLHIGRGKDGALRPNNFVTQGVIGGIPEIMIHKNSSFTNMHIISSVTRGFTVAENAVVNLKQPLVGGGVLNNDGEININAHGNIVGFALSNSGVLNIANHFTLPSTIIKIGKVYITGSGKISGNLDNAQLYIGEDSHGNIIPNEFVIANDVDHSSSMQISTGSSLTIPTKKVFNPSYGVTGAGVIYNYGTLNIKADALLADTLRLENYGILNVNTSFVFSANKVNEGALYFTGLANHEGSISKATSLNIGQDSTGNTSATEINSNLDMQNVGSINVYRGTLTTNGVMQNCGIVNNFATLQIKNRFNSEAIINQSGATLILETSKLQSPVINKPGAFLYVTQETISDSYIENSGLIQVSALFKVPAINNIGYLKNNAQMFMETLVNSGTLSSNSFIGADTINNFANFNSTKVLQAKNFNNYGELLVAGNVVADIFNNYGIMTFNGNANFAVNEFKSSGIQNFFIKNAQVFDSLVNTAAVNVEDGTVNIKTHFMGEPGTKYLWNIITATEIITNDNTVLNTPRSGLHFTWHRSIDNGVLSLAYSRDTFTKNLTKGISMDIAQALEQIALESKDDTSTALLHAVSGCSDHDEYALNIVKLKPNANANANFVSLHNATFKKVETRISAVQDHTSELRGMATGDLNANRAGWGAIFGSFANQAAITGNQGYHATAMGAIFGFDKQADNDDIYGTAVAFSRSNIDEAASINSKTNISGYHLLVYGTNFFYGDNFFEWLLTGIINQNKSEREVILSGVNLNVGSTYHNYQTGVRVNLGKNMDFHSWGLAQVNTAQYSFLHQPAYNENGSPAALHLSSYNSNIVTIGSGLRVFCRPNFHSALVAKPAVHVMVTYDAVSSSKGINANFIIGGSDFTLYQNPSRVAVRLGADIGCEIDERLQIQFSYDLEFRSRYNDNSAELKIKYLF